VVLRSCVTFFGQLYCCIRNVTILPSPAIHQNLISSIVMADFTHETKSNSVTPKITFYTNDLCPWAHRAAITLHELDLPYEKVVIDLETPRPDWYLKINPVSAILIAAVTGRISSMERTHEQMSKVVRANSFLSVVLFRRSHFPTASSRMRSLLNRESSRNSLSMSVRHISSQHHNTIHLHH